MRPPQWEYRTVRLEVEGWLTPDVDTASIDAALGALGAEGWELVTAFDLSAGQGQSSGIVAMLKRPRV